MQTALVLGLRQRNSALSPQHSVLSTQYSGRTACRVFRDRLQPWLGLIAVVAATAAGGTAALAGEAVGPQFFDFPALQKLASDGLTVPADGTYEVWVWGKGPELAITIGEQKFESKSGDRFAWQHPGQVKLAKGEKVAVSIPTNEKPDDLTNVPGYLALSTDPNFDAKRTPLGGLRTLYDGSGFKPYTSKDEWLKRREELRQQILVATGLWPMLPKTDLKPQVYGKMLRDGYSIEKVVLEAFPGFYLSGNLYRPAPWVPAQSIADDVKARRDAWEKNRSAEKKPGILCPHGHWAHGRFEPEVQKRCKQLARMGAVVFSYDMVGYADTLPFGTGADKHKFLDPQLDLMGFSMLTLQTWDSIRALDFLTALPDVDLDRVACTGASGGGTQTFILAAIDDRVQVAAPTVMVSQDMQGGCQCENASSLRIGTDNSEIAALFAPKPQIMVCCTGDWTKEFPTKGFPEVRATYALFDAADRVETDIFEFPHNYNQTTRERVYAFFAKHLFDIDPALTKELPLEADSPEMLTTWDAEHPRPADAVDFAGLKKYLAGVVAQQVEQMKPTRNDRVNTMLKVVQPALTHRLALHPQPVLRHEERGQDGNVKHVLVGSGPRPRVRGELFLPDGERPVAVTVVVHNDGVAGLVGSDGKPAPLVAELVAKGHAVLAIDYLGVGENNNPFQAAAPTAISHFTCYNRSTAAERVRDIVDTALSAGVWTPGVKSLNLVGIGSAGPLCLIACNRIGGFNTVVIDANQFDYRPDSELPADRVLPGIARVGGLRAIGCAHSKLNKLFLHNTGDGLDTNWIEETHRPRGVATLKVSREAATEAQIVAALNE